MIKAIIDMYFKQKTMKTSYSLDLDPLGETDRLLDLCRFSPIGKASFSSLTNKQKHV